MIIKLLLLAGMLYASILTLRGQTTAGHRAVRRLAVLCFLLFAVAAVLMPSLVTDLASMVGVGRGTDLVLYLLAVAFLLVTVYLVQRIGALEARCAALTRRLAIQEAVGGEPPTFGEETAGHKDSSSTRAASPTGR